MGFIKSLKGKMKGDDHEENPPAYASEEVRYDDHTTKREKHQMFDQTEKSDNSSMTTEQYTAPPGPPPSQNFAPPPGPPSSHNNEPTPPPYQDWLVVPDNSQLPPPPALHDDYSPGNNASWSAAEAGHRWCDSNPVYIPAAPNRAILDAVKAKGSMSLQAPYGFKGKVKQLPRAVGSSFTSGCLVYSPPSQDDATLLTILPLYFAVHDNPMVTGSTIQISYSIHIRKMLNADASVAIGFASKPYPQFRLPGWHRGSLAVHADDGRKYVNDPWGGQEFVRPFQQGDSVMLTMTIEPSPSPMQKSTSTFARSVSNLPKCCTRMELSRNGISEGAWDVHEERDAEKDEGIEGLQGDGDLYAAVGVCGGVEVEVHFWPQNGSGM